MKKLIYLILLITGLYSFSQTPAFPGAVGFGKNATGGRGGTVLFVTNLNNSGTGSLRAALEASGTRTVVFKVGGIIDLTSIINVTNGNLTVAGQTAPGDGILIRGGGVIVSTSNVIFRYIRFRPGPTSPFDSDAFSITANSGSVVQNVIVDHCSFSWADDENFNMMGSSTSTVRNVTVQNCIMSENTYGILLYRDVENATFYQNLFALHDQRNLISNWAYRSNSLRFEMVNNLIYGWWREATGPDLGLKFTVKNNKYKLSSQITIAGDGTNIVNAQPVHSGDASWTYAYLSGNIIPNGVPLYNSILAPYVNTTSPYLSSDITNSAYPANEIEGNILNHVGSSKPTRDAVDTRIINSYNAGTGVISNSGTYPTISNGTSPTDSDNDGMSDSWEISKFGNLSKTNNGNDLNANYTNLEIYTDELTGNVVVPPIDTDKIINMTGDVKAFNTAHGFGRVSTGGRGGSIIYVTSLANSGPGTLREALTASGARTIIFRVSGTINITSTIYVSNGNVTIAGQTAPGQGVQIIYGPGAWIEIGTSNVIIRHLKFRGASSTSQTQLRFVAFGADRSNAIVDHCSFAWSNPEEMAIDFEAGSGTVGIPQWSTATVQNSIFGELNRGILQYKGHNNISYYRNYFYGIYQRSPSDNRNISQKPNTLTNEVVNQIWHNNFHFPVESQYGARITVIGSKRTGVNGVANSQALTLVEMNAGAAPEAGIEANSWIYQRDNSNSLGPIYDSGTSAYIKSTPYQTSDITDGSDPNLILPVSSINDMLPTIGSFYWNRDSHDQRFINYYLNQNGTQGVYSGTPDNLTGGTPYTDSDQDGMEDSWETYNGLNPSNSADRNNRPASVKFNKGSYDLIINQTGITNYSSVGYTAVELYLMYLSHDFDDGAISPPTPPIIPPSIGGNIGAKAFKTMFLSN